MPNKPQWTRLALWSQLDDMKKGNWTKRTETPRASPGHHSVSRIGENYSLQGQCGLKHQIGDLRLSHRRTKAGLPPYK